VAPKLFPVVPWLSAFEEMGPGPPPVPLMVFPFERVLPVDPPAAPVAAPALEAPLELPPEAAPPELCASASEQLPSKTPTISVVIFIDQSSYGVNDSHSNAKRAGGCITLGDKEPPDLRKNVRYVPGSDESCRGTAQPPRICE
jgi:hypothetical protein